MKKFLFILLPIILLIGCNTVVGTVKGVGRDAKAVYIYTRDSVTSRPISDK